MFNIKDDLSSLLNNYPTATKLISDLENLGTLLFFGGSVRDYYINKCYSEMPRDFDIAINLYVETDDQLESIMDLYPHRKNRFDGYKVSVDNLEFDIWNMKNTWAFRQNKVKPKIDNLINTVFLSVDGIAYNYNENKLYDSLLSNSIKNREIEIVLDDNPQIELNLLRALVFKRKYKLNLSKKLKKAYYHSVVKDSNFHEQLYDIQYQHYRTEILTPENIKNDLGIIIDDFKVIT